MSDVSQFYCSNCKKKFESAKIKDESLHPIYGPCWKYIASCPDCNTSCDEYKIKVAVKSSSQNECCMENSGGHAHSGCCCCN